MTEVQPRKSDPSGVLPVIDINHHMSEGLTVSSNLHTEIIVTTRDKISNALFKVLPRYKRRNAWVGPATLLSSLVIALLSTDFNKKMFGLSAETWTTLFWVASAASAAWLVWSLIGAIFRSANHEAVVKAITKTNAPDHRMPIRGHLVDDD